MKRLNCLKRILPHIHFIMLVVFVTLLIVDICNPYMEFINNSITKGFLWFECAISVITFGVLEYSVVLKKRCDVVDIFQTVISAIGLLLATAFVVALIYDMLYPNMEYINNNIAKGFWWGYCVQMISVGTVMLIGNKKNIK